MFVRSRQLDQLKKSISDSSIKVIYGIRRGGKTTLLEQFRSYLRRQGVAGDRIIYRDFDHLISPQLLDPQQISREIKKLLIKGKTSYIFLDELEKLPHYQVLVQQLAKISTVDLYVTSSAASIKQLADSNQCRFIYLGPLTFHEYVDYHHQEANLSTLYHYLNTGGFPFAQDIHNHSSIQNYFEEIISTIILSGFAQKDALCNPRLAKQLAIFLAARPGRFTNVSQAVAALQDQQIKVSNKTLSAYLGFLQQGFLFSPCQEIELPSGRVKTTNVQYFPIDTCLRWQLTNRQCALSKNNLAIVVFNELRSRGYEVFTSAPHCGPVSFVARRNGQQHLFQFSFSLLTEAAYQQATSGLRKAPADTARTLLVAKPGEHLWSHHEDFQIVDLVDWLAGE